LGGRPPELLTPPGPRPPPGGPPPPGPRPPPPPGGGPLEPPPAARSVRGPMPIDLLIRRLVLNCPGPVTKLEGILAASPEGFRSKSPYFVSITSVLEEVANDGRSLNWLSPFKSCPTVMLNGVPEFRTTKGLIEMPNG